MQRINLVLIISLLMVALLIVPSTSYAQDNSSAIAVNQTVTGEISNQSFEQAYRFTEGEGDILIFHMEAEFEGPSLILADSEGNILSSASGYNEVSLVVKLPAAGLYTVWATRQNGRSGTGQGEYTLIMLQPPTLSAGTTVEGVIVDQESRAYYAVDTANPFTLNYTRTQGDVGLRVLAAQILSNDTNLYFEPIGVIEGLKVRSASLQIESEETGIFIIEVNLSDFYYDSQAVNVGYSLSITE